MTDISKLKGMAPDLYEEILELESSLYSKMEDLTKNITKIRNLILKGDIKEAKKLLTETKEKARAQDPGQ